MNLFYLHMIFVLIVGVVAWTFQFDLYFRSKFLVTYQPTENLEAQPN